MTAETKIGLITGLSVIIVFAMILSHKGDGRTEMAPPLRTPDIQADYADPDLPPAPAGPAQSPEPAPEPTPPDRRIAEPVAAAEASEPPVPPRADRAPLPGHFDPEKFVPVPTPQAADGARPVLPEALRRRIEGRPPTGQQPGKTAKPPNKPLPGPPGLPPRRDQPERIYIAQADDNLTRIARKFLGSASAESVNRIFELNRDTLPDKDTLRIGQRIRLPGGAKTAPPAARPAQARPKRSDHPKYVVKPGDNYGTIARAKLGSAKRWREIFELNRDRFPDPDLLPAGATIELPDPTRRELRLASR